mmetsp:Transcript_39435/g.77587  ORF Transcript_39435/g.77587 Transcript_39435/m.77587 type:complete len:142 (-) Transcript_39435:1393-1818(-)
MNLSAPFESCAVGLGRLSASSSSSSSSGNEDLTWGWPWVIEGMHLSKEVSAARVLEVGAREGVTDSAANAFAHCMSGATAAGAVVGTFFGSYHSCLSGDANLDCCVYLGLTAPELEPRMGDFTHFIVPVTITPHPSFDFIM